MMSMDTLTRILVEEAGWDVPSGLPTLSPSRIRELLADAGIDTDDSATDFVTDYFGKGR